MDADTVAGMRPRSLADIIRKPQDAALPAAKPQAMPDAGEPATLEALPKASDEYAAFSRLCNQPQPTLFLMKKDGSFEDFAYANLERISFVPAGEAGGGNELVLRFTGSVATEVRLKGRHLGKLHETVGQHRTLWVRELPTERDFQATTAAVVTSIVIQELER